MWVLSGFLLMLTEYYSRLLATASADHTIKIWTVDKDHKFTRSKTLTGHQRWVWDCVFSADSAYLVTGKLQLPCQFHCLFCLWFMLFLSILLSLSPTHSSCCTRTQLPFDCFSSSVASSDQVARLWDLSAGESIRHYTGDFPHHTHTHTHIHTHTHPPPHTHTHRQTDSITKPHWSEIQDTTKQYHAWL